MRSIILVAVIALLIAYQTMALAATSVSDVTKYAHDKRQITYEGRKVYRVPNDEIDADFEGPIAFAGKIYFVDCERNDFIKLSSGTVELRRHFAKNRASIFTIFTGMDWSNYGARSVVLTTKGILVWTGDGRAFMITDSVFVRRISNFDFDPIHDPEPMEIRLNGPLSGTVAIECWPNKSGLSRLTLDLDRELKIGFKNDPTQPSEATRGKNP